MNICNKAIVMLSAVFFDVKIGFSRFHWCCREIQGEKEKKKQTVEATQHNNPKGHIMVCKCTHYIMSSKMT